MWKKCLLVRRFFCCVEMQVATCHQLVRIAELLNHDVAASVARRKANGRTRGFAARILTHLAGKPRMRCAYPGYLLLIVFPAKVGIQRLQAISACVSAAHPGTLKQ